jgi:hypothetical protein
MVTDMKHDYGICCRMISVCFGFRKTLKLDILMYSNAVCYWASDSNILNSCSAFQTAGTTCLTTHDMTEALKLLNYNMQVNSVLCRNVHYHYYKKKKKFSGVNMDKPV